MVAADIYREDTYEGRIVVDGGVVQVFGPDGQPDPDQNALMCTLNYFSSYKHWRRNQFPIQTLAADPRVVESALRDAAPELQWRRLTIKVVG